MIRKQMILRGLLTAVIVALLAVIVYDQIRLQRSPVEYRMDIITEDFNINNINLVASANDVYLAGGWFLELTGSDPSVDHVQLDGQISGVQVFDWSSGEPFVRSVVMPITQGVVIDNLNLTGKSVLHMNIAYTVGGESKAYSEEIKLRDKIKPHSEIIKGDYKIYELQPR